MPLKEVYINNTSSFFPNQPVSNDEMEEYLGYINNTPSRSKAIVLRNNGIKNRFYALTKGGQSTHTNAQMTALAIRKLFNDEPEKLKSYNLLSCGTSSPDQMHAFACSNGSRMAAGIEFIGSGIAIRSMLCRHARIQIRIPRHQVWRCFQRCCHRF